MRALQHFLAPRKIGIDTNLGVIETFLLEQHFRRHAISAAGGCIHFDFRHCQAERCKSGLEHEYTLPSHPRLPAHVLLTAAEWKRPYNGRHPASALSSARRPLEDAYAYCFPGRLPR